MESSKSILVGERDEVWDELCGDDGCADDVEAFEDNDGEAGAITFFSFISNKSGIPHRLCMGIKMCLYVYSYPF